MALPTYYFQRKSFSPTFWKTGTRAACPSSIDIIIPANNEAEHIGETLARIQGSIGTYQEQPFFDRSLLFRVRVAADGCTDETVRVVRGYKGVIVTESDTKQGKWRTVKNAVAATTAEWVILVDAGTLWPETFIADFVSWIGRETKAMAIAPSYRLPASGWLAQAIWWIEASLKRLEALCGGPVSLHGATVGYKTAFLKEALLPLGDRHWLNDDVVIPLTLRAIFPEGLILYPVGQIEDEGVKPQMDLGRRKRILLGNIQWTTGLLPFCFRRNPTAAMIALRRLFRMFWAYWFGFLALGMALAFHVLIVPGVIAAALLLILSGSFRQMSGAAWVSLFAPFEMVRAAWPGEVAWK